LSLPFEIGLPAAIYKREQKKNKRGVRRAALSRVMRIIAADETAMNYRGVCSARIIEIAENV